MSNLMWPGPARALQFHMDLWHSVDRSYRWMQDNEGRSLRAEEIPTLFRQRLNLMTSMEVVGPQLLVDGITVSTQRDDRSVLASQFNMQRTTGLVRQEYNTLNHGETHYVSHHISTAVAAAAEQADDEALFPTDLPAESGLMVLEYPLMMPDLDPVTGEPSDLVMPVRAIGWSKAEVYARRLDADERMAADPDSTEMERKEGIFYVLYTDADAFIDIYVAGAKRNHPDHFPADFVPETAQQGLQCWATDTSGWAFGMPWRRAGIGSRADFPQGDIHDSVATMRRFLLSYFRWTWSRILVPQRYTPTRAENKRAVRSGRPLEDGYIKVMRLRRELEAEARGEKPDTDGFFYDHAWIVRGHWRRQWFKSLGPHHHDDGSFNQESHRLVWIEPHVSGNPTGPLVIGHDVVASVR